MNRIESSGTGIGRWLLATLLLISAPTVALAKGPGSGGGGKVSVEQAYPSEAVQGEELNVIITGSGFDEGSTATWYVTGTSDDTQVEVLDSEYLPATGQLKAHIKVHGNASVNDYDIEVKNSGGRRGKGTTLFKVQSSVTACTGLEEKEPEITYLSGPVDEGDLITKDIYLSSSSGCDQFVLLEAAQQELNDGSGILISEVLNLRLDVRGDQGVVTWLDRYSGDPWPVMVLRFSLLADGTPVADPAGPEEHYLTTPESGWVVSGMDIRINEGYELELVFVERPADDYLARRLALYNAATGIRSTFPGSLCGSSPCFERVHHAWWNADGSQVYFGGYDPVTAENVVARYRYDEGQGQWLVERVLNGSAAISAVSIDGLLSYARSEPVVNKRGKPTGSQSVSRVIDPEACVPGGCMPSDGFELPIDQKTYADTAYWTCDGGFLFQERGPIDWHLTKISNPLSGGIVDFQLGPTEDPDQRDTRYCREETQW